MARGTSKGGVAIAAADGRGDGDPEAAGEVVLRSSLWDDNPALVDLLGFDAVVAPVIAALRLAHLDPVTIGIHAPWGGGKSTILGLIEKTKDERWIVVRTNPWEYDDQLDVKGTLIAEVLVPLAERVKDREGLPDKIKGLLRRVSWSRVGLAVTKGALTMQWEPDKLVDAFMPTAKEGPQSLAGFREEFRALLNELDDVDRVVVLVDDLDRCLPPAVMSTLEAIKLFLSVPKMAFVIAADQDMVRDAIAASLGQSQRSERFASRYLDKIVQLPIGLPRLSPSDADIYITLLLVQGQATDAEFKALVDHSRERRKGNQSPILGDLDKLANPPSAEVRRLAAQLAQGLGADRLTNPREIKRFLNAFGVRSEIIRSRGLKLRPAVLVKLLLLEDRHRGAFDTLVATPVAERPALLAHWEEWARGDRAEPPANVTDATKVWAASEPSLAGEDLSSYIALAATFTTVSLAGAMSDELQALVLRAVGASQADRERAIEEIAARPVADQREVLGALFAQGLRADDLTEVIEGLVGLSEATPELAQEVAEGIEADLVRSIKIPQVATLAGAKAEPISRLVETIAAREDLDGPVRAAAKAIRET